MATAMLRQRNKKLARSLGILSLTATILGATLLPAAGQAATRSTPSRSLDLSNPQSESKVELDASEFLTLLLGDNGTVPAPEADYLATLADNPLKYTNTVSTRCVTVDLNEEEDTLTVTVIPYTYTSADGTTLTWYPAETATVGQRTLPLAASGTDGTRSGTLEGLSDITDLRLNVPYTCTATVPAALADRYLNLTYYYADELFLEMSDYESSLAAYNAYQDYLQALNAYDAAYAKWQEYVVKKDKYDKDMIKYTAYEKAMSEYRTALAAFEAYETAKATYDQAKIAYDTAKEAYNAQLAAYNEALVPYEKNRAEIARVEAVLAVLDSAFIAKAGNHFYGTLMGDTVATVVNKKDELVNIGKCDPNDIDAADKSSEALRTLLTEYKALKDVPARFAYYTEHYEEIKENFIELYGRLYSLYKNSNVKSELIAREKLERYIQFVSQLYVISTGLDDDTNRKEDWEIAGHYDNTWFDYVYYTYQELLPDESLRPADKNNADPTGVSCPDEVLTAPTPPAPFTLTQPVEPTKVNRPVEPEAVNKPTEPTFVKEPTAPTPVSDPGDRPIAPSYTALQQRLIAARKDGTLSKRKTGQDKTVTLHASLQKGLQPGLVEFYDYDGQTLLFSVTPNPGEAIVYEGPTPTRPNTAKYAYTFIGWKDEDGNPAEDFGIASAAGRCFYASYSETVRSYTVTWSVEGVEQSITLPYGSTPVFDGTPAKADTAQYAYQFVGWRVRGAQDYSTRLDNVMGDVTYEAVFESVLRRYTVTWFYYEGYVSSALWDYGTVPVPPANAPTRPFDGRYIYEFSGWNTSPVAVTGDVTYTAQYATLPVQTPDNVCAVTVPVEGLQIDRLLTLAQANDCTVSLLSADGSVSLLFNDAAISNFLQAGGTHVYLDKNDSAYLIKLTNASGQAVSLTAPITLRFSHANAYTKAYAKTASSLDALASTYENGVLTLRLRESAELVFRNEYTVTVSPCENGELSANVEAAVPGDLVTLTLTPSIGYKIDSVQVIGALSEEVYSVGEDMTFVMPDEPVTVSATLSRQTYTVTFIVENEVISTKTYFSGDTLVLPDDPTKAPDGDTVYTFTGWSPVVITTVTADATYTAQFRGSLQSGNATYVPPESRDRAYLLYIDIAIILAVLIATPIVTVRLVKRRRKKRASKSDET